MKNSEKATIPAPKTNTQEQVDQTLKLASAGIKVTVERVEGKEGKLEKEEEKHDSPRSSRAAPYVTPPSVSTDMMKVEMGKTMVLPSLKGDAIKKWGTLVQGYEASYGRYDRNRISVEVREGINYRKNSNLYTDSLPERLRASRGERGQTCNWIWLSHDVISSEELTSFPLATMNSGTGHDGEIRNMNWSTNGSKPSPFHLRLRVSKTCGNFYPGLGQNQGSAHPKCA